MCGSTSASQAACPGSAPDLPRRRARANARKGPPVTSRVAAHSSPFRPVSIEREVSDKRREDRTSSSLQTASERQHHRRAHSGSAATARGCAKHARACCRTQQSSRGNVGEKKATPGTI